MSTKSLQPAKPLQLAGYCRVSRAKLKDVEETTIDNQVKQIQEYTDRRGFEVKEWFLDEIISGDAEERPKFDELFTRIDKFDGVICRDLDRFGRDTETVLKHEKLLRNAGKRLILLELEGMSVDTSTPTGKMIFTVMAAFAEHEKSRILARLAIGFEEYQKKGGRVGRKPKQLPHGIARAQFKRLLESKIPLAAIGRILGGPNTPWDYRTVRALAEREGFSKLLDHHKTPGD